MPGGACRWRRCRAAPRSASGPTGPAPSATAAEQGPGPGHGERDGAVTGWDRERNRERFPEGLGGSWGNRDRAVWLGGGRVPPCLCGDSRYRSPVPCSRSRCCSPVPCSVRAYGPGSRSVLTHQNRARSSPGGASVLRYRSRALGSLPGRERAPGRCPTSPPPLSLPPLPRPTRRCGRCCSASTPCRESAWRRTGCWRSE